MFFTLIVCFLVLWYRTDLSWAAVWKSLAFHFILTKVQKDEQLDKDNAYTSHFLQSEGQKFSLIFFFPLNLFHVYLSSFNIRYLFSGYIVIKHIQDGCMNSISVFSLKYFYFFAWGLWRALEEWQVSFCKTWDLQLVFNAQNLKNWWY